jgi:hypothetical protein
MNTFGSYRALLGNSVAAVSAAVEVYNRPRMDYRGECFVILLVNGWELMLKALLSKNRERIYYKKRRGEPYRTLSVSDALTRSEKLFPAGVPFHPTADNLRLLIDYRDSAIHFYNRPGFESLIYALAQTSIVNYRDVVHGVFGRDITKEITLSLLPLSVAPPVDPVQFLKENVASTVNGAVEKFSKSIKDLVVELEREGADTGRLLTTFSVHLVSTKKIASADIVVGVGASAGGTASLLVTKSVDPNKSHPYREVDVVGRKGGPSGLGLKIGGMDIGQYQFRALVYAYKAHAQHQYCWRDVTGAVTRYSPAWVAFIRRLTLADLKEAIRKYAARATK